MADQGATKRLTINEAAERMGKSPITVYRMLETTGDGARRSATRATLTVGGVPVPVVRVGWTWSIDASDLDAALRGPVATPAGHALAFDAHGKPTKGHKR